MENFIEIATTSPTRLDKNTTKLSLTQQLLATPQFSGLTDTILDSLIKDSVLFTLATQEHLLFCGDNINHYYLLESGQIQLYRPSFTGEDKVFHIVHAGQLFFENTVFLPEPIAPLSVFLLSDCRIWQLSANALLACVSSHPQMVHQLLQSMSISLYHAINRIDTLTISNASQRLVLFLLEFMQRHKSASFTLDVTQKILAKQLNVAPETLSRMINKLCESGFIRYQRGEVHIIDTNKLKASVGLPTTNCNCQNYYQNQGELLGCRHSCC